MWFLLLVSLLTVFLLKKLFISSRTEKLINKIPGPKTYPFIGNFFDVRVPDSETIPRALERRKKYGPVVRLWIGGMPIVTCSSGEHVQAILSNSKEISKSFVYKFVEGWLGKGLLTSTGERWFKHRRLITPTFHFKILDSFIPIFESNSAVLVEKFNKKAATGEAFDVYPLITLAALDIICETAMGVSLNAQNQKDSDYVQAIYRLARLITNRSKRFYLLSDFIYNLTPKSKEVAACIKTLHNFTESVIRDRKAARVANPVVTEGDEESFGTKHKKAFLDLLLDSPGNLTDTDLREEVDTFMFEGHDTTTAGITWTLFLLGHHPDIQNQVAEEVRSIWPEGEPLTIQMLQEMKLLDRVIKESLRIYPSVPFVSRQLENDLQIGEYLVPAKSVVSIAIVILHRDPEPFPDPFKFDPDRFLPENVHKRHPFAYVPFSAGPRNCVGQKFAMLEEKSVLASVVRAFNIVSQDKREDVGLVSELITRPLNGIKIKLTVRN